MSLINRVLQDLDKRQALDTPAAGMVRPSAAKRSGGEWFWRVLVVLLTAALAWMGWVAIQLLPRKPLATELAFVAANEARARADKPAERQPTAVPAEQPAAPTPTPSLAAAENPPPQPVAIAPARESLRLATELQAPAVERPVERPVLAPPEQPAAAAAEPKKERSRPAKKTVAKSSADDSELRIEKDRPKSPADAADRHVRRASALLKQGRDSEAEEQLLAALKADPRHVGARHAYVSMLVSQHRVGMARRLLEVGLANDPKESALALELARLHAGERDYARALTVLDKAGAAGKGPEFQAFRGAMLQRLERHPEAVAAYQAALGNGDGPPTAWISYGISLEALGRRSDAADAYKRALASGPMTPEARDYAETRARALE